LRDEEAEIVFFGEIDGERVEIERFPSRREDRTASKRGSIRVASRDGKGKHRLDVYLDATRFEFVQASRIFSRHLLDSSDILSASGHGVRRNRRHNDSNDRIGGREVGQ
jgi:hypothetical protein